MGAANFRRLVDGYEFLSFAIDSSRNLYFAACNSCPLPLAPASWLLASDSWLLTPVTLERLVFRVTRADRQDDRMTRLT
jgi:hypothetical protein